MIEIKELTRKDEALTLSLGGRMDAITAADFTAHMETWIESGLKNFTADCSQLDYISSAGLRAILTVAKQIRSRDGSLQLAALQESVRTVFKISGFDKIIPIAETLDDALKQ